MKTFFINVLHQMYFLQPDCLTTIDIPKISKFWVYNRDKNLIFISNDVKVLVHTLKASSYELSLLLLMLLIPVVIFSSIVYAVEANLDKDGKFDSIPRTFWWCVITMTTVGYGDLVTLSSHFLY